MGFIPILVTLFGAIMLFCMVVNYHLKMKKNLILQLQSEVLEGMEKFELNGIINKTETVGGFKYFDENYLLIKKGINENQLPAFENEVREPYRKAKISAAHYNKLIKTKPYSFVATLLGHRPI